MELTPYYDQAGITIYCGDCLEIMLLLDLVFDAIIADLPYGTTACSWDTIIPFEPLWENYKRLVKGNGAVVLFGSQPFTSKLVMSNLEWFKYEWIWEKEQGTNFLDAWRKPYKTHENLIVFCENSPNYNPQFTKGQPYINGIHRESQVYNSFNDKRALKTHGRLPRSVQKFNREVGLHSTQKPIALLSYLIRTYTDPGEIILDNTMGSGTTLVAAQREGRRAVGIELDEDYCKIAIDRLRQPSFFSIPDKPKAKIAEQISLL